MRNFSLQLGTLTHLSIVPTLCRTMAHGVRTRRNTLWHLSLLTGCLLLLEHPVSGPFLSSWPSRGFSL